MTIQERFWSKVEKTNSCWNWAGYIVPKGYGRFSFKNKNNYSHRFAYELFKGKIPKGLQIDHLCRNRKCVNPEHLEAVTSEENTLRGIGFAAINSRKTHCIRGHLLTGNNLYLVHESDNSIHRQCRTCRIKRSQLFRNKMKVIA